MIGRFKSFVKRHWPVLRLRTIIFAILLFVAALPGISALFLRVYENTLVRQTEAELLAQSAALAATAQALWPRGTPPASDRARVVVDASPQWTAIDLRTSDILPERPRATPATLPPDQDAQRVAQVLAPILETTEARTLASIQFIDRNGVVATGYEAGGSYAALPEITSALAGRPATVFRRNGNYRPRYSFEWLSRASALRLHHAHPVIVGGQVKGALLLSRSPRALFRGLYEDRGKILLGVVAIFGLLVLLSGVLSRAIVRPIEALSRATRDVAAGRGSVPPDPDLSVTEIRALYEDFRVMAESLAHRSRYVRDFAASVSHEFKTPLSGIRGAIELLEDHGESMTRAERGQFLANISADADRLSHLVGRLMELARADMRVPDANSRADVLQGLTRVADGFRTESFHVDIRQSVPLPKVRAEPSTIEAVAATIIENSRQAGASTLTIAGAADRDWVIIDLRDDGPGIPASDREHIFAPFFTSKREAGGSGLGLAIARSLVEASRGQLLLVPSAIGAHFSLRLPSV